MSRTCGKCKFWEQWSDGDERPEGLCRRYAPRPQMFLEAPGLEGDMEERLIWPSTDSQSWCGEWVKQLILRDK